MRQFRTHNWIARTMFLLVGLFFTAAMVAAQTTTGSLQGVVKDPNGAVVAGVAVKVTNADTGITKETTTNDEGFYRITNLQPGDNYTIEISGGGFATATVEKVVIRLATENSADVSFSQAAGATGSVTVTDEGQLVQSTQSQLAQTYTPKQLTQLPFNGGLIDNIALLTPGVITPGDADFTNGVGISANGNRGRSNNFQLDGQDNNDNSVAGPSLFITNTEAIGEYQVITNSFSAEFGRNSGAQINTITKPGTNEFHGTLFEYLQNSRLNARDNLAKKAALPYQFLADNGFPQFQGIANRNGVDPFTYNRFGGSIGGPLKKNKAFFFATYQRDIQRGEFVTDVLGSNQLTFTPESALLARSLFPNAATAALVSTAVAGGPAFAQGVGSFTVVPPLVDTNGDGIVDDFLLGPTDFFPMAFVRNGGVLTTLFAGEGIRNVRSDYDEHQLITRGDLNLTDKDVVSARYIYDKTQFPLAVGRFVAGALFDVPSKNNNLGVTYTRTLSPRVVNEARFNFSRLDVRFGDPDGTLPGPGIQFAGNRGLFGGLSLTFGTQNNLPQSRKVDVWQEQDTVSTTMGNHALKFGVDLRQQKVDNFFLPNFLGTYVFQGSNPFLASANATSGQIPGPGLFFFDDGTDRNGFRATAFENFLLGRPRTIQFALGEPRVKTSQNDFFFFFQDDWRIRPNLTLNLGVRYEISTTPFNPIIEDLNEREASNSIFPAGFALADRTATKLPLDKNNFAPRVGFAWSPNWDGLGGRLRDGRTVIRAGFGIAYDPPYFNIVLNTITAAPFAAVGTVNQTPGAPGSVTFPFLPNSPAQLALTPGTNGGDPRLFNRTEVDPGFYNPYTMSFNFGIQQEVRRNTVLEARYVGSRIIGQFQTVNANPDLRFLAAAGTAAAGNPGLFTGGVLGIARPGTNGNGRVNPNFSSIRRRINGASSTYHGLQMRFDTRFTNSLTLNANYTLSKTIDNASEIFSTFGGGQTVAQSQNPFDITTGERGPSAFHQKHNFTANFIYDLPFYKDQRGVIGRILGGYQISSIMRMGSGRPYTPTNFFATYDPNWENAFIGSGALRPFNGNPNAPNGTIAFGVTTACFLLFGGDICNAANAVPGNFIVYNTLSPGSGGTVATATEAQQQARLIYNDFGMFSQFGVPLSDLEGWNMFRTPYGDVGRNTFRGLPFYLVNLAVFKTTNITEGTKLEFRVEANNLLNRRNFGVPDPFTEDAFNGVVVSSFQNPGFNNGSQRELRFGLRFIF